MFRCTSSTIGRITEAMMNLGKRTRGAVDVLILEDNHVPHLPSRAFGSVQVNRLFLEGNRMASIDRNAFAGRLKTVQGERTFFLGLRKAILLASNVFQALRTTSLRSTSRSPCCGFCRATRWTSCAA